MAQKKFFVDINLQGNKLANSVVGANSSMTTGGAFQYSEGRLEYYDGATVQEVANLADISAVTGGLIFQGGYDAFTNTPDITDGTALKGYFWAVSVAGSFLGESVQVGDSIVAKVDNAGATIGDWLILQGNVVIATDTVDGIVRLATQAEADAGTEGGAVVITPATLQGKIDVDIAPLINSKVSKSGDSMTGNLNMTGESILNIGTAYINNLNSIDGISPINLDINIDANTGNTIINLPAPVDGGDAANKTYVDNASNDKLPLAGGTMSGAIDMGNHNINNGNVISANYLQATGDTIVLSNDLDALQSSRIKNLPAPIDDLDATRKVYVDGQVATALPLAGGTMYGSLDMGGYVLDNADIIDASLSTPLNAGNNTINNLPAPVDGADAANKTYVDGAASTAQANAEATANSYTNEEIAAQSYVANIEPLDWTLSGGSYYFDASHGLDTSRLIMMAFDNASDEYVELTYERNGASTRVFTNILPLDTMSVSFVKAQ